MWSRTGRINQGLIIALAIVFLLFARVASVAWDLASDLLRSEVTEQIVVDQFGWRPQSVKVALFANPLEGQNSDDSYSPGSQFQLKQEKSHQTVYVGSLQPWNEGQVDQSSGDQVWSADFTAFQTPGSYYLYDPKNHLRSYSFRIEETVFDDVLKSAVKAFYYQRCGTEIPSQFGGQWVHPPCHIGRGQDLHAKRYASRAEPRDVHGGWHDAGDFNKYVLFTSRTLWSLLNAYEGNPSIFTDDLNIPESGNTVPDLLDEVKWELDWLLRMQLPDGSVLNRVASQQCDERLPQKDLEARYYTEPTTWATSSLIIGAAYGSRIFEAFGPVYPGYGEQLKQAAEQAWQYLDSHPSRYPQSGRDYGTKERLSCASQADEMGEDFKLRLWAAAELYRATDNPTYKAYFETNYVAPEGDWLASNHYLGYISYLKGKDADARIVSEIKQALQNAVSGVNNLDRGTTDPYRAYIPGYGWGSNRTKAHWGSTFLWLDALNIDVTQSERYRKNAEEYVHYLHGRNPLSLVYLSNMGEKGAKLGAQKSVMEIYHSWFHDGSPYDGAQSRYGPAPGFLTGGPNQFYSVAQVTPPANQPPQKAYRDWNSNWNRWRTFSEASWEITEPAIYYQAAYVHLLSGVLKP